MAELRFDHFMQHALHHPTEGYYAKHINSVGRSGDFSTSASLSSSLAKSIAQWICTEAKLHQLKSIHILEVGAGTGQLMKDVRNHLPLLTRRRCRFHIVETSAPLRERQHELLGNKAQWHDSVQDLLSQTDGSALIYSNELVDAFPVRIFRRNKDCLEELYIDTQSRHEIFKQADDLPDSEHFNESHEMIQGRFEIHQSYATWLSTWADSWKQGSMLTIDYGDETQALRHTYPTGTLRGYFRHERISGDALYHNVGHQDLTCDINFSDLIHWGKAHNWRAQKVTIQADFIDPTGKQVDQFLTDADGAGKAFKVLTQRTGTE